MGASAKVYPEPSSSEQLRVMVNSGARASARVKAHPDPSSTSLRTLLEGAHAEGRRRAVATRAPLLGAAAVSVVVGIWLYLDRRVADTRNYSVWLVPLSGAFIVTGCYLSICSVLPTDRLMPFALCVLFLVLMLTFGVTDGSNLTGYWVDARAICAGELTDEQRAAGASADDCPFSYVKFGTTFCDFCVALIVIARSLRVLVPTLCYGPRPCEARISAMKTGRFAALSFAISLFMRDTLVNLLRASSQQTWHHGVVIRDCYNLLLGAVAMSPWGIHKWDALQTWRSEFVAQYRREPIIWMGVTLLITRASRAATHPRALRVLPYASDVGALRLSLDNDLLAADRLCIDQKAITESLPLLPVYLAGCNSLLILAGPTYTQRLWCWDKRVCLIEIFVWLEIGGDARETVIYLLAEDTDWLLSTVDASTLHGVEAFNGRLSRATSRESSFQRAPALQPAPRTRERVHGIQNLVASWRHADGETTNELARSRSAGRPRVAWFGSFTSFFN
ncbi:hypothetical protein T492DRAFT_878308 [Pavlovales sp. CCMP2436]|nr:hypothetical protein T492DRAFT_878308 [Pavlovales sp. CCMP2436]